MDFKNQSTVSFSVKSASRRARARDLSLFSNLCPRIPPPAALCMVLYGISYLSQADYASEVNGRDLLLPKPTASYGMLSLPRP
jgi:hypothetical protein